MQIIRKYVIYNSSEKAKPTKLHSQKNILCLWTILNSITKILFHHNKVK